MNKLTGKVAVITGGTQGLGATIARLFADRGAAGIVTCGRSVAKGQAKAKEIQDATGTKVVFVAADLGKVEDCRAVIAKADAEFGRVEVAVGVDPHAAMMPAATGANGWRQVIPRVLPCGRHEACGLLRPRPSQAPRSGCSA